MQHAVVEQLQLGVGLDGVAAVELVTQHRVRRQRLDPPPAAVEGQHVLAAEALPRRVEPGQLLQLGQQLAVPPGLEVGLHPALQGEQPQLLQLIAQPARPGPPRALGVDVLQRLAAPQRQRLLVRAPVDQQPEPVDVEQAVAQRQHVRAGHGRDHVFADQPPQLAHITADQGVGPVAALARP
ncbi:hypothetical protein GCM10020001_073150 [Nonomuraea salmonea]